LTIVTKLSSFDNCYVTDIIRVRMKLYYPIVFQMNLNKVFLKSQTCG